MQSPSHPTPTQHVTIIPDGSGRWAVARGLPRPAGHRAGLRAVRRTVSAAPGLGIRTLTLFAFSITNWRRPEDEVEALMEVFRSYLTEELPAFVGAGTRVSVLGRRDRLPPGLLAAVEAAEPATRRGRRLHLRLAVDYSSRDAILDAARSAARTGATSAEAISRCLSLRESLPWSTGDVDLLIRTGGEQRLSDFLLWESAHAELLFTRRLWPDFGPRDLAAALRAFQRRERRFGGISVASPVVKFRPRAHS